MSYQQTQQRVTTLLLWLFYAGSLIATPAVLLDADNRADVFLLLVGHTLCAVVLIAHRRGATWTRQMLVLGVAAVVGLLSSEPFLTQQFTIAFFLVPTLALVLSSGWWVLGASGLTYAALILRGSWDGPYSKPLALIIAVLAVGGLALARFLVDAAIRRAEEQAALLEEQAGLLASEQANLALRVEERTRELSAANAALIRAGEAKTQFLASVSHELRTPLNIILGSAELVGDGIYGPVTPQQQQALERVSASGQHLLALINDILDVARMERGSFTLELGPVGLARLCAEVVDLVAPAVQRKGLALAYRVAPTLPAAILDERRVRQILLNLLSNAVKFTPPGGRITLTAEADTAPGWLCLAVADTGIGIAAEQQALLFNPFVQLDAGLDRNHEGTGLGLALVAQLAQLHGGEVRVESAPGAGSRFLVRLPLAPPAAGPLPLDVAPAALTG